MNKFCVLFGFILLCATFYAGNSTVVKPQGNFSGTLTVSQFTDTNITAMGQIITLTISILNNANEAASAYVEQGLGNVEPVSPLPTFTNITDDYIGARSPYISWTVDIAAGETKDVTYQIKPKTVGPLSIGPAAVWVGNKVFYSNSLIIKVACSNTSICDESIGETPLTCPSKCAASNATGNTTPDFQPVLIPTSPIPVPNASAQVEEIAAQEKQLTDEANNKLLMWAGGIVLVIGLIVAVYFLFFRKGEPKRGL